MNDIERYAVGLVGMGAESYAVDDRDEEGGFADQSDWLTARSMGIELAGIVKNNPEEFLRWARTFGAR
jgi:hypothetical protein